MFWKDLRKTEPQSKTVPILIFVDNQGAIKISKNDTSSTRTKHIEIQYHFVKDSLSKQMFSIDYCPTKNMAAYLLTKPLQRVLLEMFKTKLGLQVTEACRACDRGGSVGDQHFREVISDFFSQLNEGPNYSNCCMP